MNSIPHRLKNCPAICFTLIIAVLSFFLSVSPKSFAETEKEYPLENSNVAQKLNSKNWLDFSDTPEISLPIEIAGAFIGKLDGVIILAGGFSFSDGIKTYSNSIYILKKTNGSFKWQLAGTLPMPVANGAAITCPLGLICMGGENNNNILDDTILLKWNQDTEKVTIDTSVTDLPEPLTKLSAALLQDKVYIAGGRNIKGEIKKFYCLNLTQGISSKWNDLPAWPGRARDSAVTISQHVEDKGYIYLFSGKNGKNFPDLPRAAASAPVAAVGQSHILLFSGENKKQINSELDINAKPTFADNVLSYHTITNTWSLIAEISRPAVNTSIVKWNDQIIIPGGQISPQKCSNIIQTTTFVSLARRFGFLDQFCLYTYLTLLMLLGFFLYYFKDQKTSDGYFLGGRNIPGWAAGLSLMATGVSSIGFMAIPAKTFVSDWTYFVGVLSWVLVIPIVIIAFIPFFMRVKVTTAYELLEARFDVKVRTFAATAFSFMEIGRISIVLLLPATALATVTNLSTEQTILLMGIITTVYTVSAGMQGVIWSDVCQGFLMIAGALLCIAMVLIKTESGPAQLLSIANADAKFNLFHLDWSPASAGLWVVLVGNVFNRVASMTSNQASVQRFLSTSNKKEATKTVLTGVLASVPWAVIVFLLGTALYVFYKVKPGSLAPHVQDIQVLPFFMAQELPPGVSGIIIAAIFAAGMSSIDSSIHSLSTTWTNDFLARFRPKCSEKSKMLFAKSLIVLLGIVSTAGALAIYYTDIKSMWDFFIAFFGLFSGVLCGIFVLAIFFKRTNAKGALFGGIASFIFMQFIWYNNVVHPLLYAAVGVITCVVFGHIFSPLSKNKNTNS
jgi:SSS family transporter